MKFNFMDVIMRVEFFILQTYLRYMLRKGSDRVQKTIQRNEP